MFNECCFHSSIIRNIIFPALNLTRSRETLHRFISFAYYEEKLPSGFRNPLNTFIVAKGKLKKFFVSRFLLFYLFFIFTSFCIFFFCYYPFFALLKTPHLVRRVIVLLAKYFKENLTGRSNQINKFVFYLSSSTEYFLLEFIR